ncbi:hypothetical protein ACJQWK_06543 [Exserohilum turcicum]
MHPFQSNGRSSIPPFHKQQLRVDLEWRKEKKGQAAMVNDIKAFFQTVPRGSEITVLIRCIDRSIVHRGSFNQFIRFVHGWRLHAG